MLRASDHIPFSHSQSKGLFRQEGEAAAWRLGPGLSAFISSCERVRLPSHILTLLAVLEASSGNTVCVSLGCLTSAIPPSILQLIVLKSGSLLEPGEVFYSLLINC